MKVAQIVPCLGNKSGGPPRSVYDLARGLRDAGVDVEILTQNYEDNPNGVVEEWIKALPVKKSRTFEYNRDFKNLLSGCIKRKEFQLFHINSIYSYPTFVAASLAIKAGLPYVIAPRGCLYQSAIESSSKLKKRLFNELFLKKQLNCASAVHATCAEEMESIRQIGVTSPVAIIPNSIKLPKDKPIIAKPDKLRLCHLGRINPHKNIKGLIKAWYNSGFAHNQNTELLIIGSAQLENEKAYLEELHRLESELGVENIRWVGQKEGVEKEKLLRSCSYLVMPSFSENFGMVVPEALQFGIPVVASKGSPWQILVDKDCGWWTDIDDESLTSSLRQLLNISDEKRIQMGIKGQELVYERFSSESVCKMQKELYRWILEGGEKPIFVKF